MQKQKSVGMGETQGCIHSNTGEGGKPSPSGAASTSGISLAFCTGLLHRGSQQHNQYFGGHLDGLWVPSKVVWHAVGTDARDCLPLNYTVQVTLPQVN